MLKLWCEHPEGQPLDVIPFIRLLTTDILLKCICGLETNCQLSGSHSPYVSGVYDLCDLIVERVNFIPAYIDWIYAMMPSGKRNKRTCKLIHKFSKSVVAERRKQLSNEDVKLVAGKAPAQESMQNKHLDFIEVLLKAKDLDGIGLSDDEIQEQVDTFLFEGHDTTAASISWTLYNLARFPEHQQNCRDEVDALFDEKGEVGFKDLNKLVYLKYCIKESLRLHPPVAGFGRTLAECKTIDDLVLPKGTSVSISAYAIHHHPDVWEEPEKFDPLRFTPENSQGRSPHAYIPFSAGPRNCIGQEFAMNEERVVLSHILRNFYITQDESHQVVKTLFVVLRPKHLYLVLKRRF